MNTAPDPDPIQLITRREAVLRVSALLGGAAFVGASGLLSASEKSDPRAPATPGNFTAENIALLDEIADTILPATKTPGAKAAKTGAFMALMVTDCYGPAEQKIFRDGMQKVDEASKQANKVSFMEAMPAQRHAVLSVLDREQKKAMDARGTESTHQPAHYFRMMKELALLGYFTSEPGCTQALRYIETPGRFDPCVPCAPGEPAWAAHA